jgi:hypothetical protein
VRSAALDYGPNIATIEELAERFRSFGRSVEKRAPLYCALALGLADQPDLVKMMLRAPETQQQPTLFLAAVHDLVLREPDLELAEWYGSVTVDVRTDDPFPTFAEFCRDRSDELLATFSTMTTQTNEVGRCAFYLPAFGVISDEVGQISLVDVGTSAGLNLHFDNYSYRYSHGPRLIGDSAVSIEVGTRANPPIPAAFPRVNSRIGIDRAPLDLADDDVVRWLMACLWPDQVDRIARLKAAVKVGRSSEADIRMGDAIDLVATAVDDAANTGHPVIMNSWVLNYFTHEARCDYLAELDRIGSQTDMSWVYAESPILCSGLPFPHDPKVQSMTVVMLARWRNGLRTLRHLANVHPHGYWLHWQPNT